MPYAYAEVLRKIIKSSAVELDWYKILANNPAPKNAVYATKRDQSAEGT